MAATLVECEACGHTISREAAACPSCGHPLAGRRRDRSPVQVQTTKSRGVAVLLALFLGGIGAHKFYVDKPGVGLLYLLFFWTLLPALAGLIEALQYAMMSDLTFQEKYERKEL